MRLLTSPVRYMPVTYEIPKTCFTWIVLDQSSMPLERPSERPLTVLERECQTTVVLLLFYSVAYAKTRPYFLAKTCFTVIICY